MTRKPKQLRRSGIASFELVMSFPILMFLVAMLFTLYFATMKKSQLTMEVRHNAWLVRTDLGQATGSRTFGILDAHRSGEARQELTREVNTYRNWYPNVPRQITWGNVVLAGSWDHRQVEFSESRFNPIYPHISVLIDMISGGVSSTSGAANQLSGLTNIFGN